MTEIAAWDDGVKVCLAITCNHPYTEVDFMMQFMHMIKPKEFIVSLKNQHIKSASLNEHVAEAANRDCTHILFMDVDMQFPATTIPRLLSHNLPVVSGLYYLKDTPFSPICGWISQETGGCCNGANQPWKETYYPFPEGVVEVHWTGIGCLMVDMDVFNKIYFPPFKDDWNDEHGSRQKGHDVKFCETVRKVDYKVFVDSDVDCTHVGKRYVNKLWVETYHEQGMDVALLKKLKELSRRPAWWNECFGDAVAHAKVRSCGEVVNEFTLHNLIPEGSDVCDMGCGDGGLIELLAEHLDCKCVGYDFSPVAVNYARQRGVNAHVLDIRKSAAPEKHDYVTCSHVLEHMPDDIIDDVVQHLVDSCKKRLIVLVPQEKHMGLEHCRFFDKDNLTKLLEPHVKKVSEVICVNKPLTGKVNKWMQKKMDEAYEYRHLIAVCDV